MVKKHAKLTHKSDEKPVLVQVNKEEQQQLRKKENEAYLNDPNVKAFLATISWAEGGDYDYMYGASPNRKNWRITDYSLPPQKGFDGRTTASGRYQINLKNWEENGKKKMGLTDFSPKTQDLIAVEGLRQKGAIAAVISGDMELAISKAAGTWNALPLGKGKPNRVTDQPYKEYDDVIVMFKRNGGKVTKE